jgi:hypothetical protein
MLTGLLGIRLLLLVGDTVPLPAPYEVSSALKSVEVTNDDRAGDGFQLTFKVAKDAVVDYGLVLSEAVAPFKRIVLGIVFGALPEVLIDGIVTHLQLTPSEEPGASTLTVTGRDVSVMLDLEEKNEEYPNQPDFVIATRVLAGYAQYGLVPQPTPTTDVPIFLQRIPRQQETDLRFLNRLAGRNGFVFYVEPITLGVNKAYFGPENRLSFPQPALTTNLGPSTNVRGLSFSHDGMAPVATQGSFVEPITKTTLPIPALPPLKVPPLVLEPAPARRTVLTRDTAQESPVQAALSVLSSTTNAPDAVTAQGEVDSVRYGHVLRARQLVGVRGAGFSYDGLYYVSRVTHRIEDGGYSQRFSLSREGTKSLTPAVPP